MCHIINPEQLATYKLINSLYRLDAQFVFFEETNNLVNYK